MIIRTHSFSKVQMWARSESMSRSRIWFAFLHRSDSWSYSEARFDEAWSLFWSGNLFEPRSWSSHCVNSSNWSANI